MQRGLSGCDCFDVLPAEREPVGAPDDVLSYIATNITNNIRELEGALNRIAAGTQTVSVWKDARDLGRDAAAAAVTLAKGEKVAGAQTWNGGEKKVELQAQFLKPVAITAKNLDVVVKAGWIKKEDLCKGVDAAKGPAACK